MNRCLIALSATIGALALLTGAPAIAGSTQAPRGFTALFTGNDRTTGYFGFAGHNDPVMFRNIAIRSPK